MRRVAIAVLAAVLVSSVALAEIPQVVGYQGRITDNSGVPVDDGTYTMRFRIYTAATGGALLWDSSNQSVTLDDGIFSVLLGESPQPAISLAFNQDYWLSVQFDGEYQNPRKRLASVGYAYMASGLVPGTAITGSSSGAMLTATNTNTSGGYGFHGVTAATVGGRGVYGQATATTGGSYAVYGESASTEENSAIFGYASGFTGYITYGVHGRSVATAGAGVRGWASSSSGVTYGVRGRSGSTSGRGVSGYAAATTGTTYGVHGSSASPNGIGTYGYASDAAGFTSGGYFATASINGTGLQAEGDYRGARLKDTDGGNYCYAGYDAYKTYGTGTNAFVQNHPQDNGRVIVYAAPEGDEVATYTRGTARLVDGEALVPLGETFRWVTNPEIGLTAHLTSRGEAVPLAVVSLTTEELVVRGPKDGPGDLAFDYIVYGLRIGFEEVSIVQQKQEESYIPSMKNHREAYAKHPDLRRYNALERFRGMHSATYGIDPTGRGAADRLHDAVGEYDPAVHGPLDSNPEARADAAEELVRLEQERLWDEREQARLQRGLPSDQPE